MLDCCKLVTALAVILLANCVASQELKLNSTLYSTIYGAFVAFSNQNVSFTCIGRGSNTIMGWSSAQYIATGSRRLEFISAERPGTIRTSGDTVALLIDASVDEFIISRLYIGIQSNIPIAKVQCQNTATSTSITFSLADNDTSVICDKQSVCSGEAVTCVCAVGSSRSIAWLTDGRRLLFTSSDPLLTIRQDVSRSSAILTNRYNRSGIQMIVSNLTLTASTDDTILLARCENVDRSTSNAALIPISQNCPDPNEATTLPGTEPTPSMGPGTCSVSGGAVAAAIVIAILCVCFIALLVIAVSFALKKLCDNKALEQDLQQKKDELTTKGLEITDLNTQKKDLEDELTTKGLEITDLKTQKEKLKREIDEKNDVISSLEGEREGLDDKIRKLKNDNKTMKEKVNGLRDENQQLLSDLQNKEEEIKQFMQGNEVSY